MVNRMGIAAGFSMLVLSLALLSGGKVQVSAQGGTTKKPASEEAVPALMESVGLLAALQLYQTYLNIGFLADARAENLYNPKSTQQLLDSIMTPLETVEKQLVKVQKIDCDQGG